MMIAIESGKMQTIRKSKIQALDWQDFDLRLINSQAIMMLVEGFNLRRK